jgi:diguanylate cyclase (GGDEF)-like protein
VGLGCGAAPLLRGRRYAVTVACAGTAPVVAMVFHDQLAAQAWAVVPLMFMAMFVRTWHGVGTARVGAGALSAAAVAALLLAPAPVPPLWLVFYVVSILGAAEVFGVASAALVGMALRDPLTALWNRAGIDRELPTLVARAQRTGAPIAVLVFDIDNFKTINDRHGHPAGDEALSSLAHTLVGRLPKPALLGRLGGDEFVVVAPGYDHKGAQELAGSLVDGHTVDVSFGVAVSPPQTFDIASIFARADADLYRRKRQRKDGVPTCD